MDIRLTPLRVLVFGLLVAAYWWIGGFEIILNSDSRGMLYRAALFIIGAGCVTVVEHEVGTMERTSLRLLYVILGLILMSAAVVWTRSIHSARSKAPRVAQAMIRGQEELEDKAP